MSQERDKFEAWDRAQYEINPETYAGRFNDRYVDRAIQCRWECWLASRRAALEEAAQVADSHVDPEWPNDDQSAQAASIASAIRKLGEGA